MKIILRKLRRWCELIFLFFLSDNILKQTKQDLIIVDPTLYNVNNHSQMGSASGKAPCTLAKKEMISKNSP